MLTKDGILNTQDLTTERVEVPEWEGFVYVRSLTGRERDAFEASMVNGTGPKMTTNLENLRAKLVVLTAVDENAKRLFADSDVAALGEKSAAALQRIFNVAQRMSGLTDTDIEELAKNS